MHIKESKSELKNKSFLKLACIAVMSLSAVTFAYGAGNGGGGGASSGGGGGHAGGGSSGGGGGAAHSSGGGGAVSSGGGHAEAPSGGTAAQSTATGSTAVHAAPSSAMPAQTAHTNTGTTTLRPPAETSHTANSTNTRHINTSENRKGYIPRGYADRYRNDYYGGTYYGFPYWPYSNGYYNTGNYGYPVFTPSENTDPNEQNSGGSYVTGQTPVNQTTTQTNPQNLQAETASTTISPGDSSSVSAQITNAVAKSPAMVTANNSVALAQKSYDQERNRVMAGLRNKPEYQQALQKRDKAAQDISAAKNASGGAPTGAVVSAAETKLDAGDEVTKMEAEAVATDPSASSAKSRLDQATADRDALKAQLTAQYQAAAHGQ